MGTVYLFNACRELGIRAVIQSTDKVYGEQENVTTDACFSMNPFSKRSLQTKYLGDLKLNLPSKELQEAYEEKRKEVMESKYAEYLKQSSGKKEQYKFSSKGW